MSQFHFDPDTYMELMAEEVPAYPVLQAELKAASSRADRVTRILDLGTGTGVTAKGALEAHPEASLVGLDESDDMLAKARTVLPESAELRVGRLEDPLPAGPFDLVTSALAVHHLDGPGKADLFKRIAAELTSGGRFVLADVVVPEDPADVVTPIDGVYDKPSSAKDQIEWLRAAGFEVEVAWSDKDLVVLVGERAG